MLTDIYIKHVTDPGYDSDSMIENQEFDILLSQIKMTLLTPTRSVLGFAEYGVDEEEMLFRFSSDIDLTMFEANVRFQLKTYCSLLRNRDWDVTAYLMPDDSDQHRDAVHVMLTVDKKPRFIIAYS